MIVSFTPIRAGSRSVPNKNIRILNGKPLFHHVVLQALKVSALKEVWISTDSDHYAALAPPGVKVHRRSAETATDKSITADVVLEFLKTRPDIETIVLLQATSPTTTSQDVEEALRLSASSGKGCVSVQPANVYLYEDNKPLYTKKLPRQDNKTFAEDSSIYVIQVADFLKTKAIPTVPCHTMVIKHPVCDIDTEEDFQRASALVSLTHTAFIDIDETYVRLKSNNRTEKWSTQTLCEYKNQLKSFILDQMKQIYESEIYINTGGNITEEEENYLVSEASENIPFLKGTIFPRFVDGKSIKMQVDGDYAVMELVLKNNIPQKNVLIVVFCTGIVTGLYINGNTVKNAEIRLLLDTDDSTNFETSDAFRLARDLIKIKKALSLDDVYVSGIIHKHKHCIEILEEHGIKSVDSYFNICRSAHTPSK